MKILTKILIGLFILSSFDLWAKVDIYPICDSVPKSEIYQVTIIDGPQTLSAGVYTYNAKWKTNNCKTKSWCSFAMDRQTIVRVKLLVDKVSFAQVLPRADSVDVRIVDDHTIEFALTKHGQYSVEFQQGIFINHPLLIFADPTGEKQYAEHDENVIYFGKGVHHIGDKFEIKSNQVVYLAPGAYVKGQMLVDGAHNVKICGQGVLSGEDYPARSHQHMIQLNNSHNVSIEGITIIEAPRYCIAANGSCFNTVCKNVKMLGWWFSTDGISGGRNCVIEDCFFKVNDDAIKLYHTNTMVRNCVIWQMENGAPFQIGWNMGGMNSNFYVNNVDIIRVEHQWDNPNEAVFNAIHGGSGTMENYLYENIRIDNCNFRLFHITTMPNRFGKWNPSQGEIRNIAFNNITCYTAPKMPNLIRAYDSMHPIKSVSIKNLTVDSQHIMSFEEGQFVSDSLTKNEIVIN